MFKSLVYHGNSLLGEVEIYPQNQKMDLMMMTREIRVSYFSPSSERCPPLAVLHTISPFGVCFKMESKLQNEDSPLFTLHYSCLRENKTAVMRLGEGELHLVAMSSRKNPSKNPWFWGFYVAQGLYNSSLTMLNLRCLGIVFDLDETLIVANTMRSFEDRIDALKRKIMSETDSQRVSSMLSEVKRYEDDKSILKQYVDGDQVVENGRVVKVENEVIPPLSGNHQSIARPLIRLQEKNIILTRINPSIRDTSVLVRLRPAWEELRSYLTARGRKRFEVYVCTMAERDYALEMWRLLDPESNLIGSTELLNRIVCVKAGSKKSLANVFHDGICHPKMALVIDDRLKVWDDKDQPQVHVVPAFAPYYAPQAEANNVVPVLCVARNVACNVRGGFFKEFDEGLLQRVLDVSYEDDMGAVPSPPDVSNFLIPEDAAPTFSMMNNIDPRLSALQHLVASSSTITAQPTPQGSIVPCQDKQFLQAQLQPQIQAQLQSQMQAQLQSQVQAQLQSQVQAQFQSQVQAQLQSHVQAQLQPQMQAQLQSQVQQPQMQAQLQPQMKPQLQPQLKPQASSSFNTLAHVGPSEPSLQSSPAREEGEVPESELDPDTRRRLLILQHGQDARENASREPSFPIRPPPPQIPGPPLQPRASWFPSEEQISPRKQNRTLPKQVAKDFPLEADAMRFDKQRPHRSSSFVGADVSVPSDRTFQDNYRLPKEGHHGDDRLRINRANSRYHSFPGEEIPLGRLASSNRLSPSFKVEEMPLGRSTSSNRYLQVDSGKDTPKDCVGALQNIAIKCGSKVTFKTALCDSRELQFSIEVWLSGEKIGDGIGKTRKQAQLKASKCALMSLANKYLANAKPDQNIVHGDLNKLSHTDANGFTSDSSTSESSRYLEPSTEEPNTFVDSVSALKELCMTEGLAVDIQAQPTPGTSSTHAGDAYAQVEIGGQIYGRGTASTVDVAKMQAAEEALVNLKIKLGQGTQKRLASPRSYQALSNKRLKQEFSRVLQRIPSTARYSNNAHPVP